MRAIWAQSSDGVIGDGTDMPWHLPEDLAHFKTTTMGADLLMGRATYDSIGRPLPGRRSLVLTHRPFLSPSGEPLAAADLPAGLVPLRGVEEIPADFDGWLIGGGQLFTRLLPLITEAVVTRIDAELGPSVPTPVMAPSLTDFAVHEIGPWQESPAGSVVTGQTPVRFRVELHRRC
ncbi:MAG: dihydrofolate reductase [Corynebacterium sp.]|nr:dihydrofolate reductase [Corynebacterium sp.]